MKNVLFSLGTDVLTLTDVKRIFDEIMEFDREFVTFESSFVEFAPGSWAIQDFLHIGLPFFELESTIVVDASNWRPVKRAAKYAMYEVL